MAQPSPSPAPASGPGARPPGAGPDAGAGAQAGTGAGAGAGAGDEAAWWAAVNEVLRQTLPAGAPAAVPAAAPRSPSRAVLAALALCGVAALAWGGFELGRRAPDRVAAALAALPSAAPSPVAPAALPPAELALIADAGDTGEQRLVETLARVLGAGDGLQVSRLPARGWSDGMERLAAGQPRLAIARQDALRLARHAPAPPLAVVMPLFPHEVQVLVRADSPLRYLHELRGQRLNVGPGPSARRLSARTLYEQLFAEPLPVVEGGELDEEQALPRLLLGDLDAMVLVGPQASGWAAALPASRAGELRVLALDPGQAASRRALELFLPAELQPQAQGNGLISAPVPTLALMSFLVTAGQRGPQADAELGRFAAALCRRLPALGQLDPSWRQVVPERRVATGWPGVAAVEAALQDCGQGALR